MIDLHQIAADCNTITDEDMEDRIAAIMEELGLSTAKFYSPQDFYRLYRIFDALQKEKKLSDHEIALGTTALAMAYQRINSH
jgi:hypothetical protein